MTAAEMAQLHRAAFQRQRPWSKAEFQNLLADKTTRLAARDQGFGLLRVLLGEAEILTLAVHPTAQRKGVGRRLVTDLIGLSEDAERIFLEVAESNSPAQNLYRASGFAQVGRRSRYYRYADGGVDDALIFALSLPTTADPVSQAPKSQAD